MRGPRDTTDDAAESRSTAGTACAPNPAQPESAQPGRLKRRADFLRVGRGRRWHGKAMTVQAASQDQPTSQDAARDPRVGFTLTRKVGCAVVRNRARRRLREAVRLSPELPLRPGSDYVIVGRLEAIRLPFAELKRELARAAAAVHRAAERPAPSGSDRGAGTSGKKDVRRRGRGDGRSGAAPAADDADSAARVNDAERAAGTKSANDAKSANPAGRTLERTKSTP